MQLSKTTNEERIRQHRSVGLGRDVYRVALGHLNDAISWLHTR